MKKRIKNSKRSFVKNHDKSNFIYRNFLLSLDYLKEIKNYVWFSAIVFFGFAIFGYFFPVFFVDQVKNMVEQLVKQTQGLNGLELIRFIIANNVQSAFIGALFGILFGIIPIGIIVINGYVLGFVANASVHSEGILILWKLFPHGIFEIPAILISVAVGIKLGLFLFTYKGKNKWEEFWRWILNSVRVFIFIVIPLLVIAGIIEGTLIWLLG